MLQFSGTKAGLAGHGLIIMFPSARHVVRFCSSYWRFWVGLPLLLAREDGIFKSLCHLKIKLSSAMTPFARRCPVSGSNVRHCECFGLVCNVWLKCACSEMLVDAVWDAVVKIISWRLPEAFMFESWPSPKYSAAKSDWSNPARSPTRGGQGSMWIKATMVLSMVSFCFLAGSGSSGDPATLNMPSPCSRLHSLWQMKKARLVLSFLILHWRMRLRSRSRCKRQGGHTPEYFSFQNVDDGLRMNEIIIKGLH